jgi:hypothetical protein
MKFSKKLLPFGEFWAVCMVSSFDPFVGFWLNVAILIFHWLTEEETKSQ